MELLIVFVIVSILSSIMKSFRAAGKPPARPPVSRGDNRGDVLKRLDDILTAEIERANKRRSASQYEREQERQYEWEYDRQEEYYPAEYRVEIQQPVSKKGSERKKGSVPEPPPRVMPESFPTASSTVRPLNKSMQRAEAEKRDYRDIQEQLVDLLGSEKIALGIVASEVLSAPRAKRPFQYRR